MFYAVPIVLGEIVLSSYNFGGKVKIMLLTKI